MRLRVLILIALALIASGSLVSAQTISIDHIDGLNGPGAVQMGVPITFHIRMASEGSEYAGITNGWRIFSPTGAEWDTTIIAKTDALTGDDFDLTYITKSVNVDGMGSDTVGIVGAVMFNPVGMPLGFDSVTHLITIGPIDPSYEGGTICIDSCFYFPSGVWKWAGATGYDDAHPNWAFDGAPPYCFAIGELIIDPPVIDCPTEPFALDLCAPEQGCLPLPITGANTVEVTGDIPGATWENDALCFTPPATDGSYNVHIEATNDGGTVTCDWVINVTYIPEPAITCPAAPIDIELCELVEICIPLPILNADDVSVDNQGSWAADELCFTPAAAGTYIFNVTATEVDCQGEDNCQVTVNVSLVEAPVITCPTEQQLVPTCEPGNFCIDLPISGADVVTVPGATWADGQLCFDATEHGVMTFNITAENCAGTDNCTVEVLVDLNRPPTVVLEDKAPVVQCEPAAILLAYTPDDPDGDNLTEELISPAGTIDTEQNTVSFTPPTDGTYEVIVRVTDPCGAIAEDTSYVEVDIVEPPVITCPGGPIDVNMCEPGQICIDLPISDNFDEMNITGPGTWVDDLFCFQADAGGTYEFSVDVINACHEDNCTFTVNVAMGAVPFIDCPGETIVVSQTYSGELTCVPLTITGENSVNITDYPAGWTVQWADDQLCFDASTPGVYDFAVHAVNDCGESICSPVIEVLACPRPVIACPDGPLAFTLCEFGEVCIELPIENAGAAQVIGATWLNDTLCFTADAAGSYSFQITAENDCGGDTCDLTIDIDILAPVTITCPEGPITVEQSAADLTCIGLPIAGATSVDFQHSHGDWNISWSGGQFCFDASVAGEYFVTVRGINDCGMTTCDLTIIIEEPQCDHEVVFDCPVAPIEVMLCEFDDPCEICFELPMDFVGSVEIDYPEATWANDTLCFIADTLGTYTFHIIAYGMQPDCVPVECDVEVIVTEWVYECSQMILSDTEFYFSMGYLDTENPTPQALYVTTPDDPFCYDLVQSGGFTWLSIVPDGCTGDEIAIVVDGFDLQPGSYSAEVAVVADDYEICDPAVQYFNVYLDVLLPFSEEDIIHIPTVPSVPGARVGLPIMMENPCDVTGVLATFEYYTDQFEYDSASFGGSSLADWTTTTITVNGRQITLDAAAGDGTVIAPGASLMVTLWFTIDHMAMENFYPINAFDALFETDCYAGDGTTPVEPTIIPGGIIIGPAQNYVCGYVVDPDMNPIEGATVELWAEFPVGSADDVVFSNATGLFEFFNSTVVPFDLHAYKSGYYPATVWDKNYGDNGILIVLTPIEEVIPTDMWINLYCGDNFYMNEPLPVGSVVDAYDPDGVHCGSFTVTEPGSYGFMPVYHDDSYTNDIDEGTEVGDIIRVYVNGLEAYHAVTPIWTSNGDVQEICLEVGDTVTQQIDLAQGWNLVSWRVNTEVDEIATVLASIGDDLDVVLGFEGGGLTYDPDMPLFSNLYMVDHFSGYFIKVDRPVTLTIVGGAVPSTTPIDIDPGWNLISYLPTDILEPAVALAGLGDALKIALGYDGGYQIYEPGEDLTNTLTEMGPGHGYWLRSDRPTCLIYPGGGPVLAPQVSPEPTFAKLSTDFEVTNQWMNVYTGDLRLDGSLVPTGATVTAHNADGDKIGSFTLAQDGLFGFMAVYGDDMTTDRHEGVGYGEAFTLRINGAETNESFTWTAHGDRVEIGELTAKSGSSSDALPSGFRLMQNYPNPFNPNTVIGFSLPAAGKAKVEVFNILGRQVATVFDDMASAGYNEVTWDGRSGDGTVVSSGIYFYRLTTEAYTDTRKMTLLK